MALDMRRLPIGFFLLFLSSLVGCRPVSPREALTPTPLQATPLLHTLTPTYRPVPTATLTPMMPTATFDIIGTVVAANQSEALPPLLSPDGNWRAEVSLYPCASIGGEGEFAYEQLTLIYLPNGSRTLADEQLQACGGLGAFGLKALFWSSNSRYLYYTNAREGVPDGCGYWTPPYLRIDVTSMRSEMLGGGMLSPDRARLATWQGQELVLWDIDGGEIGRVSVLFPDLESGPLAWSPDGQALVYLQVETFCPLAGVSNLVLLELPDLKQSLLLASPQQSFGAVFWEVPSELRLLDEQGKEWRYNFNTKKISPKL